MANALFFLPLFIQLNNTKKKKQLIGVSLKTSFAFDFLWHVFIGARFICFQTTRQKRRTLQIDVNLRGVY